LSAPAAPAELAGRAYLRLILLGAAIGIPAALLAAGFLALVHELEDVLWHDLPDPLGRPSPPWYLDRPPRRGRVFGRRGAQAAPG